ncbi:MAG: hypothetical protein IT406_00105 [Candidatus Yanofskybacteria bacterium]|nr:hypothetical protein [Candidatus Yanofskybacteria bacterium]
MNSGAVWKMVGLVALVLVATWSIRYLEHIPPSRLASLLGVSVTVSDLDEGVRSPSPSPSVVPVSESTLGSVAVQTFSGSVLIRQGAGTSVSSDGLVLTTSAAAPYGSGSFVYQVATPRGQVLRARRVAGDRASGLTLLKVDATDLPAVVFEPQATFAAGAELSALSGSVVLGRFVPERLPMWVVSWSDADHRVLLSLDRAYGARMHGARMIDESGRSVGIFRWGGQPSLIDADGINAFLDRYLQAEPLP